MEVKKGDCCQCNESSIYNTLIFYMIMGKTILEQTLCIFDISMQYIYKGKPTLILKSVTIIYTIA